MPPDYKVKFHSTLTEKSNLIYGVSKGNYKQTGINFEAFVIWINKNKRVSALKIVLSDWLHRFYVGEEEALLWGKNWEEENKISLNKLIIPYQLIHWKEIIETKDYQKSKLKVMELFEKDNAFQAIVNGLANNHKHKAGFTQAQQYLLEEIAALCSLEGILTYPSKELNGAVIYAMNKLNDGPKFIGHMLVPPKVLYNPQIAVSQAMFKTLCALNQAGYNSPERQIEFFLQSVEASKKAKNDFSLFAKTLNTLQKVRIDEVSSSIQRVKVTCNDNQLTNNTLKLYPA